MAVDVAAPELPVLLLGDPRLRVRSAEVADFDLPEVRAACASLGATLQAFRARHGFGRAISAPQVGVPLRIIAVNLGDGPFFVVNPRVTAASGESFSMWDDCMSFPGLLVRLRRDRSISLAYEDESGSTREWQGMGVAASELLQHEIDHLDGILAIDRAIDREAIVLREVWEARRSEMRKLVDYEIGETP
jgi:peptide deformylase